MTELVDIVLPDTAYLESILQGAIQENNSEEEYVSRVVGLITELVKEQPERYALYGPYWPAIKELIVAGGDLSFGQVIDSDVAQVTRMSRPALTVLAALLYSYNRAEDHTISDPYHYLDVQPGADDTEPYLYVSYDESIAKFQINK